MKYITYEEPFKGKTFTENGMRKIYKNMVDKAEYSDYECWKIDMLRFGIFEKISN